MTLKFSEILTAMLIIGVFIGGFFFVAGEIGGTAGYNVEINDSYQADFDKTLNVTSEINSGVESVKNITIDKGSFLGAVPDMLIVIKNMIMLPLVGFGAMTSTLFDVFDLPSWATTFIIMFISIAIIISLGMIIFRFRDV